MAVNINRCKLAYRLAIACFVICLLGLAALGLQFEFRKEYGLSNELFIGALGAFFGGLFLSHLFAGWLAALNGLSWIEYGLGPLMKPIGGVAFSIFELRAVGKKHGWV